LKEKDECEMSVEDKKMSLGENISWMKEMMVSEGDDCEVMSVGDKDEWEERSVDEGNECEKIYIEK